MPSRIFINYRRGDDPGFAGRLFDQLEQHIAEGECFLDVDSIPPGEDFVKVLDEQVSRCDVFLALIGKNWLNVGDAAGRPKLEDPDDFVRIELSSAFKLNKRMIPILINNAEMPSTARLPETLKPFAKLHAQGLTHDRFKTDVQALIKIVVEALEKAENERRQRREETIAKDAETARLKKEQLRVAAQADEVGNWEFIKGSTDAQDFRDHLKRFAGGLTEERARVQLERAVWSQLGEKPLDVAAFIAEFPNSLHLEDAKRRLPQAAYSSQALIAFVWLLGVFLSFNLGGYIIGEKAAREVPALFLVCWSVLALFFAGLFIFRPVTVAATHRLPWLLRVGAISLSIYWLGAAILVIFPFGVIVGIITKDGLAGVAYAFLFGIVSVFVSVVGLISYLSRRARALKALLERDVETKGSAVDRS